MSDPTTEPDPSATADPYARLGLPPGASDADVKRAYRALARKHHPDRNPGDPGAERRFRAIAEAYEVLSDPALRRRHDAERGRTVASEEFLADFTDALERAERIVLGEVLPRYQTGRAERVARLARDYATSSVLGKVTGPRPGLLARWRARREARRLAVHVDYRARPPDVAEVWPATSGWVILLYPGAFWAHGVRDPAALDDAVLTVLLGRVLAILAHEARADLRGVDGPGGEAVVARARDRDLAVARARAMQLAFWGAIAALSAVMLYSAWASQRG